MDQALYENHLTILRSELSMALGCTEPIAIAYAAAKARQLLGEMPEHCTVHCSGNIVKNVMGVTVPNSGGLRGIDVAATLGIVGGNPELELAVLEGITDEHRAKVRELLKGDFCSCKLIENVATLYIVVELTAGEHSALVEIQNTHKNITRMQKDGVDCPGVTVTKEEKIQQSGDRSLLTVKNIMEFADEVKLSEVEPILTPQIECNMAICREGLEHSYGAEVGRVLLEGYTDPPVHIRARAYAACGICYLLDYPYEVLCDTITNTIATVGGMVCDGAKSSCASKIATAVETALLGMKMGLHNRTFQPGEGLVNEDVEETISNIGRMGRVGMKSTDNEILNIMLGN